MTTPSPFIPGAKVARYSNRSSFVHYVPDEVLKVRSNGNFTLKSDPSQQYRPSRYRDHVWSASATGESYHPDHVRPWDADLEETIRLQAIILRRRRRLADIKRAIAAIHDDSEDEEFINTLAMGLAIRALKSFGEKS